MIFILRSSQYFLIVFGSTDSFDAIASASSQVSVTRSSIMLTFSIIAFSRDGLSIVAPNRENLVAFDMPVSTYRFPDKTRSHICRGWSLNPAQLKTCLYSSAGLGALSFQNDNKQSFQKQRAPKILRDSRYRQKWFRVLPCGPAPSYSGFQIVF